MDFEQMRRRLSLLRVIVTADRPVENTIVAVHDDRVEILSAETRTGEPRNIPFDHILTGNTSHGSIIRALRIILGLE